MNDFQRNSGFSLIEALIAFAVLTVGLLGAVLFHSTLLSESGTAKAQSLAIKVAEKKLEELRDFGNEDDFYSSMNALVASSPISTAASGVNANYTVVTSFASSATNTSPLYTGTVTVNWTDPAGEAQSVSLSSNISWLDPLYGIDVEDAGSGVNNTNLGIIEVPRGLAQAVARVPMSVSASAGTIASEVVSDGVVYGVGIGDDSMGGAAVSLVKVKNSTDPIIKITGRVINNKQSEVTSADFDYIFAENATVIDVQSSTGSNCVFYNFDLAASGADEYEYGDYVCLMSEGWAGNISIISNDTATSEKKTLQDENNFVCYNSPRSYKYLIVQTPEDFNPASDAIASDAIKGQSGLVRFNDSDPDGYHWNDYFWHNDYLLSTASSPNSTLGVETLFAGDVFNQSYVVTHKSGGISECDDLDYDQYFFTDEKLPSEYFGIGRPNDPINHDEDNGVILGYTTVRFTIAGELYLQDTLPAAADGPEDYDIIGNPQPTASITCDIASAASGTESVGAYTYNKYPYTCNVPIRWDGAIVVQSSVIDGSIKGCPDDIGVGWSDDVVIKDNDGNDVVVDLNDHVAFHYYDRVARDYEVSKDTAFVFAKTTEAACAPF